MAISNITNFITKAAFPAFLIPASLRRKHENISRSLNLNNHLEILFSAQNSAALQMLNKSYHFSFRDDLYQSLAPLGVCRVVSLVINFDRDPELGLSSDDSLHLDFFPLSDLLVGNEVVCIN